MAGDSAVETTARLFEEFRLGKQRGDLAAIFDSGVAAPDFELTPAREYPEWRVCRGRDEVAEFMRSWLEDFDQWDLEVEELTDAGNGRVVAVMRQWGTGHGSSTPVELRLGVVVVVEAGQATAMSLYADLAEAEAVASSSS